MLFNGSLFAKKENNINDSSALISMVSCCSSDKLDQMDIDLQRNKTILLKNKKFEINPHSERLSPFWTKDII